MTQTQETAFVVVSVPGGNKMAQTKKNKTDMSPSEGGLKVVTKCTVYSPYASSAWCSGHSTTPVGGHSRPCLSLGVCDSPGGRGCDTPDTQPAGCPLTPSFAWRAEEHNRRLMNELWWWFVLSGGSGDAPANDTRQAHFHGEVVSVGLIIVVQVWQKVFARLNGYRRGTVFLFF